MKSLFTSILLLLAIMAHAQDPHYSQHYGSPMFFNPAATGFMEKACRASINYRNQWRGGLGSNSMKMLRASFEYRNSLFRKDFFAVGGFVENSSVGAIKYKKTDIALTGSYIKEVLNTTEWNGYLVLGAQAGMGRRAVNKRALLYGDQWNGEDNGWAGSTDDPTDQVLGNKHYPDCGVGLMYTCMSKHKEKENGFYVGLAIHHIGRPSISMVRDGEHLFQKLTLHAGGALGKKAIHFLPAFIAIKQGPSWELNAGAAINFLLAKQGAVLSLGTWFRATNHYVQNVAPESVIPFVKLEWDGMGMGFSYDVLLSNLKKANGSGGAYEFSLYCKWGKCERRMNCPSF